MMRKKRPTIEEIVAATIKLYPERRKEVIKRIEASLKNDLSQDIQTKPKKILKKDKDRNLKRFVVSNNV